MRDLKKDLDGTFGCRKPMFILESATQNADGFSTWEIVAVYENVDGLDTAKKIANNIRLQGDKTLLTFDDKANRLYIDVARCRRDRYGNKSFSAFLPTYCLRFATL